MTIVEYIPGTGVTEEVHLSLGLILILGEVGLVETYHSRFCFLYSFLLVQKKTPGSNTAPSRVHSMIWLLYYCSFNFSNSALRLLKKPALSNENLKLDKILVGVICTGVPEEVCLNNITYSTGDPGGTGNEPGERIPRYAPGFRKRFV